MTYLVMAGNSYYPTPDYDIALVASTREQVERLADDLKCEDWIIVFEIDGPTVRRFRMPTERMRKTRRWERIS